MAYQFVPLDSWLLPPHRVARYAGVRTRRL
jgi:hypothetical protein